MIVETFRRRLKLMERRLTTFHSLQEMMVMVIMKMKK